MSATSEFEILHTEAKEFFFGALKACDIASSLDRRIRFEGDVLHRLTADGTSSSVLRRLGLRSSGATYWIGSTHCEEDTRDFA